MLFTEAAIYQLLTRRLRKPMGPISNRSHSPCHLDSDCLGVKDLHRCIADSPVLEARIDLSTKGWKSQR